MSNATERACTMQDVRYIQDIYEFWTVDGNGVPAVLTEKSRGLWHYRCKGCQDRFDTWQEVLRHMQLGGEHKEAS